MTGPGTHVVAVTDATSYAGAEVSLRHLVSHLNPALRITIAGVDTAVIDQIAAGRRGCRTVLLPASRTPVRASDVLRHRRLLRDLRPGVVHVNLRDPSACRAAILAAGSLRGVPVVAVEHLPVPTPTFSGRLLSRITTRLIDVHVAVGHGTARQVEQLLGLPPGSATVIHNGIPGPWCPNRASASPHRKVIGTVGRLDVQKDLDLLLHAVAGMEATQLVLIGDGPQRQDLRQLATQLGIADRVTFAGWVDDPGPLLATCDAFALPSRHEGFPLAVLEAMARHVPVVATDVGSVRDAVVHEETGLLVPPGDVDALRVALQRVLDDASLAVRLADNAAVQGGRAFSAAQMARAFELVYANVVPSKRS